MRCLLRNHSQKKKRQNETKKSGINHIFIFAYLTHISYLILAFHQNRLIQKVSQGLVTVLNLWQSFIKSFSFYKFYKFCKFCKFLPYRFTVNGISFFYLFIFLFQSFWILRHKWFVSNAIEILINQKITFFKDTVSVINHRNKSNICIKSMNALMENIKRLLIVMWPHLNRNQSNI